jgi:predicted nucleic acid-binding protein
LLVVDAAALVTACLAETGLEPFAAERLVAPHLIWSEASSVLHELRWRQEISVDLAATASKRLAAAPVSTRRPRGLDKEAWHIADRLGWAKTYDAEYLALARILKCRFLTIDRKLRQVGAAYAQVIGPEDFQTVPPGRVAHARRA